MIRFEFSTKINFISPALRAWGWGTLLIMQWASEVAYLPEQLQSQGLARLVWSIKGIPLFVCRQGRGLESGGGCRVIVSVQ